MVRFFCNPGISTKEIDVDGDAADVTDALKKAEFAYTRVDSSSLTVRDTLPMERILYTDSARMATMDLKQAV